METEFGLRRGLLLVFLWRRCTKLGHLKDLGPEWEAYCSKFYLIVLKCLFKDPIVVLLTLLTLKTLLQVNVNPL